MGWVTVDDFESGSLSGDWSGPDCLVVSSSVNAEGTYALMVDSSAASYVQYGPLVTTHSKVITRDAIMTESVRAVVINTDSASFDSLVFCYTDDDNYYYLDIDWYKSAYNYDIRKVVNGTVTSLAEANTNSTVNKFILIKMSSTEITAEIYPDNTYTTPAYTLNATDSAHASGKIGFRVKPTIDAGNGITDEQLLDNLEVWESGAPAAEISKVKVAGSFSSKPTMVKIGGTFVEKIMKVRVGGTFQ